MSQHASTRLLVGLTSCIAIVSFIAYKHFNNEKKGLGKKKSEKDIIEAKKSSFVDELDAPIHNNEEGISACKPMFDCNDNELTKIIVDMADQRAKRWMSFRVSGAHSMVGQVGGKSHRKRPILILDTFVMKPVSPDHRGIREIAFYEAIQAASKRSGFKTYCSLFGPRVRNEETNYLQPCCDVAKIEVETKLLHRLEPFTARYFGTLEYNQSPTFECQKVIAETNSIPFGIKSNSYILLNNVSKNFSKPCVLDIKLGTKTFEQDASEEKKSYELKKYPSQSDFGFRLTAMRIYDPSNAKAADCGYVYYPKQFGRSLGTRESLKQALLVFLGGANLPQDVRANRSAAIQMILSRLKMIKGWLRDNKSFAFYGSSILVIYEGDIVRNEVNGVELDMACAKMIDFGRVRRQHGGDLGYFKGIVTLIVLLEEILKESFLETSKYIRTTGYPTKSINRSKR